MKAVPYAQTLQGATLLWAVGRGVRLADAGLAGELSNDSARVSFCARLRYECLSFAHRPPSRADLSIWGIPSLSPRSRRRALRQPFDILLIPFPVAAAQRQRSGRRMSGIPVCNVRPRVAR